jgi:hypothetical protein
MQKHRSLLTDQGTIMALVMQRMTVVTAVTGIFLSQEKALHIIQKSLSMDILMASATIALLEGEVMQMRLPLVVHSLHV